MSSWLLSDPFANTVATVSTTGSTVSGTRTMDAFGVGRGLSVSDNGVTRDRVFDGTALIVDGDTRVTYGPDGRVLGEAFETVEGHGKNAHTITVSRDVLTDLLGSAVGIAEDGIVNADLRRFGDFGDTLSAPTWDTVTSFTGHVETAGLVEFATRTYDPETRVWVQEDGLFLVECGVGAARRMAG